MAQQLQFDPNDVTNQMVEEFRQEAGQAGDEEAVKICTKALAGNIQTRIQVGLWIIACQGLS